MSDTPTQTTPIPDVTLRPVLPEDTEFLFELYSSTRQEELEGSGWDAGQRAAFLQMQFRAQQTGYHSMFPDAEFQLILLAEERVGWMVVHRAPAEFRLVHLALLPPQRSIGIGARLMRSLLAEATQARQPVRLHVLTQSRAVGFYKRFGFQKIGEAGCYDQMEWRAR